MNDAIGCQFGSVFEAKGEKLQKVNEEEEIDELRLTDNGGQNSLVSCCCFRCCEVWCVVWYDMV